MKVYLSRFIVCLTLLLSPTLMFAGNATVDCTGVTPGSFTTFASALASLPPNGPNFVNVVSNCTDRIFIHGFNQLQIFANPGTVTVTGNAANRRVLSITDSTGVFVDGINFKGGLGILVNNSQDVFLGDGGMQNSGGLGMLSLNSVVDIFNFAIQNSVRSGVSAQGGSFGIDGGVTISNNGRFGVSMQEGHLTLSGGDGSAANPDNVISGNGFFGISVAQTAELDAFGGNDVTNNGFMGVRVVNASSAFWSGGTITGNKGVGFHIAGTSHGDIDTVTISGNGASVAASGGLQSNFGAAGGIEIVENSDGTLNGAVNVTSNQGTGILTDESSVLSSIGGSTVNNNTGNGFLLTTLSVAHFFGADTATGNTKEALECDDSSVLVGTSGLGKEKCSRVRMK